MWVKGRLRVCGDACRGGRDLGDGGLADALDGVIVGHLHPTKGDSESVSE